MNKVQKIIFFLSIILTSEGYAAGHGPGTTVGFDSQKSLLTKSFDITYPAEGGTDQLEFL